MNRTKRLREFLVPSVSRTYDSAAGDIINDLSTSTSMPPLSVPVHAWDEDKSNWGGTEAQVPH